MTAAVDKAGRAQASAYCRQRLVAMRKCSAEIRVESFVGGDIP